MTPGKMKIMMVLITCVLIFGAPLAATASEPVTIQGEVNDSYQIVDGNGAGTPGRRDRERAQISSKTTSVKRQRWRVRFSRIRM